MTRIRAFALTLVVGIFCCAAVAAPAGAAPDPLSDADGDAIPFQLETQPEVISGPAGTPPRRCTKKQRLRKGRCVPRCKKGKKLKRGKCVRKKPHSHRS